MDTDGQLYLRCYGDKQHVGSPEEHVGSVANPDISDGVHEVHTHCNYHRENTESQFSPHCPGYFHKAYNKCCKSAWWEKKHKQINVLIWEIWVTTVLL